MMGHPDAGRYVSRIYLRELALLWFLAGVGVGALVVHAARAFFFSLGG